MLRLRYQRPSVVLGEQILGHVLHRFLILTNLLRNIFKMACLDGIAAARCIRTTFLKFMHLDCAPFILLGRLQNILLLRVLAAPVCCEDLRVRRWATFTILILHQVHLILLILPIVLLHQTSQEVFVVSGALWDLRGAR